jgi:8-oxo-dGTP pyrophosphatase MutT (NUDIX family)
LPGGGQEPGEDFVLTLTRECQEEIGAEIVVGDIRYIREYIGKHHEFSHVDADVHQIEFMFLCELKAGSEGKEGSVPDQDQMGIEWLPLEKLESYRLYPRNLRPILAARSNAETPIYLGDIN